ncbi:MAG: hypothetical protein RL130_438, partial [Actinomycetota bacterium]
MRRSLALALIAALAAPTAASAASSASLSNGSTISISTKTFTKSTLVTVTGKNFDETVGIY